MQAGAEYFHAVQPALILKQRMQENEMQKAVLLLYGVAPHRCGHTAFRPRVAKGCCTVEPSHLKSVPARCSVQPNSNIFPFWKEELSHGRSQRETEPRHSDKIILGVREHTYCPHLTFSLFLRPLGIMTAHLEGTGRVFLHKVLHTGSAKYLTFYFIFNPT